MGLVLGYGWFEFPTVAGPRAVAVGGVRMRGGRLLLLAAFSLPALTQGQESHRERPYIVLKYQNLALSVSVLSFLLFVVIMMAIWVYKPIRRR